MNSNSILVGGYQQQQQQQPMQPATSSQESTGGLEPAGSIGAHQQKSKTDAALWSTEHASDRRYFFSISGSLASLADNPESAVWKLANEHAVRYRPFGSKRGSERIGNPEKAIITAVYINWISNGFDKPIVLCSDQLGGNLYSGSDKTRSLISVGPGMSLKFGRKGKRVFYPDDTFDSNIIRQHGDLTEKDLDCPFNTGTNPETGQQYDYYSVHVKHPVGWLIMRNSQLHRKDSDYTVGRNTLTDKYDIPIDEDDCFRTHPYYFKKAIETYKAVIGSMNFHKMIGLDLFIKCPDTSFDSNKYLESFCNDPARLAAAKCACKHVMGELRVVFRLGGHGLIGSAGKK